jgi:8-oxo-dGTP diphosphatase
MAEGGVPGPRPVVTAFLVHGGKVLLLRRSPRVSTFPGLWAGVSGSLPPGEDPLAQAYREVAEETGLPPEALTLRARGAPLLVQDAEGREWLVHPFAFRVEDPSRVRLDWEHTEMRWEEPEAMRTLPTVPGLWEAWERVRGGGSLFLSGERGW